MLKYFIRNTTKTNKPNSALGGYIARKLDNNYILCSDDKEWLDTVDKFWNKKYDNKSVLQAFKKAFDKHGDSIHIDPFELCIDAGVCNSFLIAHDEQ
jgi:hypothetical protein